MRKIEQAAPEEKQIAWRLPPNPGDPLQSFLRAPPSYSHWDNVDKKKKPTGCNHLTFSKRGERLPRCQFDGAGADSLRWSPWPLSHILRTASSLKTFPCQKDTGRSFKTIYDAIKCFKLCEGKWRHCRAIYKVTGPRHLVSRRVSQNH